MQTEHGAGVLRREMPLLLLGFSIFWNLQMSSWDRKDDGLACGPGMLEFRKLRMSFAVFCHGSRREASR